jgi:hypothetical protein
MFAIRQIIENSQGSIPIPPELLNRRIEVIFIDIEPESLTVKKPTLALLANRWKGERLERENKKSLANWLLENMRGLGELDLPDRNEADREIPFQL